MELNEVASVVCGSFETAAGFFSTEGGELAESWACGGSAKTKGAPQKNIDAMHNLSRMTPPNHDNDNAPVEWPPFKPLSPRALLIDSRQPERWNNRKNRHFRILRIKVFIGWLAKLRSRIQFFRFDNDELAGRIFMAAHNGVTFDGTVLRTVFGVTNALTAGGMQQMEGRSRGGGYGRVGF